LRSAEGGDQEGVAGDDSSCSVVPPRGARLSWNPLPRRGSAERQRSQSAGRGIVSLTINHSSAWRRWFSWIGQAISISGWVYMSSNLSLAPARLRHPPPPC